MPGAVEQMPPAMVFVVRVTGTDPGLAGIVRRVKTGEAHRFHGAEALAQLIAQMAARGGRELPSPSIENEKGNDRCARSS